MDQEFKIIVKSPLELTQVEVEKMFDLNTKMYPDFKEVYEANRYYSYNKPDMLAMVFDGDLLIADGNWGVKTVGNGMTLAFFGLLVETKYQGRGVGRMMADRLIQLSEERGVDMIFASTKNPIVETMMINRGFQSYTKPVRYKAYETHEVKEMLSEGYKIFIKARNDAAEKFLNEGKVLEIGLGPI
ncbi:GNAT family N-acetyltransferase [Candidatus Dojkabacteria bacterium]|uniref:GNAT family N-acetyltransferase n=1 Tax=Candidatus Dojkabacteria bacterium TaxID=2099670 RepID=A0A955L8L9_9BACT|nr:GNAT family N-acetyltransferase [Candidatus Dojkabacteria bacterium]